jgi:hypothetical protein
MSFRRLALVTLLTVNAGTVSAQSTQPARAACVAPEHRQFDFWIGEWNVQRPDGAPAGRNLIEPILGGCALRETWHGAGGSTGTSYNVYDRSRRVWHQTWVDGEGNLLQLEGGISNGRMVLRGESRDSAGGGVLNRITWEPTGPGRVRQLWETSSDSGKTWAVVFDGRYAKR